MSKNAQRLLQLFKIETTEGTDAVPVVATNAIITIGLDASKLEGDKVVRQLDGLYAGARPSYYKQIRRPHSFGVEISGSGTTAIAVPAWMGINRVCAMDAGVPGGSSVVQSLITPLSAPSATCYPFWDNLLISSLGTRGNMKMTFEDGMVPMFNYDMQGFPPSAIASESAPGAPTAPLQAAGIPVSTQNTTFTFGGFAVASRKLEIDLGMKPTPRSLAGPVDRVILPDRAVSFTWTIEHPDLASKNYFTNCVARSVSVMQVVHGTVAGNIVQIDAARCEIDLPQASNEDGILMQTLTGSILPTTAGNDELTITSK